MKKILTLFTALLFVGVTSIWGADIVVTLENIGHDLGSTANTTMDSVAITAKNTTTSYKINYYQCKKQGESMLMTKSVSPFVSNHTAMPGDIKSVKVTINSGASGKATYDCAFSASECTSAISGVGAVNITGGNSNTYNNPSVTGKRYFCITLGNANNGQVLSLEITCAAPTEPLITTEPDSIGFGVKNIFNNDAAKSGSATIKVTGANLDYNISAALDKKDNGTVFSLSTASLDKASSAADLIVSYSVTATGSYDDTLRLTSTGAPTVKIPITLKVISELQLIDTLTRATTGVTGYSYSAFADKGANLDAEYSGVCAGSYSSIQLRNNADNSGLVSTFSDGFVRKVAIVWDSQTSNGRYVEIYGSNTAYTGSADLYDYDTDGTLLGTIKKGESTELEIEEDYKYIGFLANNTLYMDTIFVTWAPVADKPAVSYSAPTGGTLTVAKKANNLQLNTGDQVAEGKKLIVTATPNGTTHMGGTIVAYKTGDPNTKVTITDGELTMPDYPITIAATFDPRPRVELTPASLDFGTKIEQGDVEAGQTFVISGEDLTGALTVTMPNAAYAYEVTDGTLTPENGSVLAEITVTPVTTEFGNFNGKININGGGLAADTAQVDVKMTIIAKSAVTITPPANGTISVKNAADGDVASGAKVVVGKRMKVTVAPNDEKTHRETLKIYKTGDVNTTISVDANDSITMPDYPITITADEVVLYTVALDVKEDGAAASHGTSATMNGGTADVYKAASETVALTATRVTGYQFVNWTASTEDITFANAENTSTTATIKGAGTITANFQAVPELLVSVTALDLGYAKLNGSLDAKKFTISGASLVEGDLTFTLDESIKDAFTVTPNPVAVNGTLAETVITVTPVTTTAGNYSGNLTISGGGLAEDKTVALTSEIEQTYTVTWSVNGEETSQTDIENTTLTPPATGTLAGKVFVGWAEAAIDGQTDVKPTFVALTKMPAEDKELYAVYASGNPAVEESETISLTSSEEDWVGTGTETYFSEPYGMKTLNAKIVNKSIADFENYANTAGEISIGFKCLQNGGTGSRLTISLVDKDGNAIDGTGKEVTPVNTNNKANMTYKDVTYSSSEVQGKNATGYMVQCTTLDKAILVNGTRYTITIASTLHAYITNAYEVTFDDPSDGTLVIKNGEDAIATGDKVAAGTTLTVTATPDEGFVIDEAIKVLKVGEDVDVTESVLSGSTLTMPAYAIKLSVSFKQQGGGTGVDNIHGDNIPTTKVLRDNQIFILRGDKTYTIDGQLVK